MTTRKDISKLIDDGFETKTVITLYAVVESGYYHEDMKYIMEKKGHWQRSVGQYRLRTSAELVVQIMTSRYEMDGVLQRDGYYARKDDMCFRATVIAHDIEPKTLTKDNRERYIYDDKPIIDTPASMQENEQQRKEL